MKKKLRWALIIIITIILTLIVVLRLLMVEFPGGKAGEKARELLDLPIANITRCENIILSKEKTVHVLSETVTWKLISTDPNNEQACVEVFNKKTGLKQYIIKKNVYSPVGTMTNVQADSIELLRTWPEVKTGKEAAELLKELQKEIDTPNNSAIKKIKE